jgi:hypothetical protein
MPMPKSRSQSLFTTTRAVSGLRGSTSHFASASRSSRPSAPAAGCGNRRQRRGDLRAEVLPVAAVLQLRDPPLVARELLEHGHGDGRIALEPLAQARHEIAGRPELRRLDRALRGRRNLPLDLRDLPFDRHPPCVDGLPGDPHDRRLVLAVLVGGVVQDRVDAEELLLREWVVLVVVALATGDRGAHPGAHRRVHAVDHRDRTELLVDRAPLTVGERVAVEAGRDPVVERGLGQQVAGELADCELVEGHVAVERPDDPVAPAPDRPRWIVGVAGAVCVAGQVEPLPRHVLAVAVVAEQPVDEPLDGVGRRVGHEGVDLLRARRQAGEVEREPADERGPVGLRLRREPLGLQPGEDEAVDVVSRPGGAFHGGHGRTHRRHVGPVRLVAAPRCDPACEQIDLPRREPVARLGGWHHDVGIVGGDAADDLAGGGIARNERGVPTEVGRGALERVEPQAAVAAAVPRRRVGPVAAGTAVGEDPLDVAGERRRRIRGRRHTGHGQPRTAHAGTQAAPPRSPHAAPHVIEGLHHRIVFQRQPSALRRGFPSRVCRARRSAGSRGPGSGT